MHYILLLLKRSCSFLAVSLIEKQLLTSLLYSFIKTANMEGYLQNVGPQLRQLLNWPRPLPIEEERVRLLHEVIFCNFCFEHFRLGTLLIHKLCGYHDLSTFTLQPLFFLINLVVCLISGIIFAGRL